jgi:nucleoside-diphosphate-sugar epimerase
MKCLVTGGSGYLGQRLCVALIAAGAVEVRTFDVSLPVPTPSGASAPPGIQCFKGDIRCYEDLCAAMKGCTVVFHAASFGMSGKEMLQTTKTRDINLRGTETVLRAARASGVRRLVYTSTYNSVFGGAEIIDGDETLPIFPPDRHVDEYSRTKALAERAVLDANSPSTLGTCAIRAAAIYGPGEARHFPRIARLVKLGAVCFSVGPPSTRVDWVRLVCSHCLLCTGRVCNGPVRQGRLGHR